MQAPTRKKEKTLLQRVTYCCLVDVLPTLAFLVLMAVGMFWVAQAMG